VGLVWGKVRNNLLAAMVGAIGGTIALYISWGVWIFAVLGRSDEVTSPITLLAHPRFMWRVILWINSHGTWGWKESSSSDTVQMVTGAELWAIWACEAAVIIGFGIFLAYWLVNLKPFCEGCGQWCKKMGNIFFAMPAPQLQSPDWREQMADPKQLLENKQFAFLEKVSRFRKPGTPGAYAIHLYSCTQCGMLHTVSLTMIPQQRKGTHATLVNKLLLTAPEAESVRRFVLPAPGVTATVSK
jgi:hypothetical protein